MKKLNLNLKNVKILNLVKKYIYHIVVVFLVFVFAYYFIFAVTNIRDTKIDESNITAKEEKINEENYARIIKYNNNKKQDTSADISNLKNPF